MCIVFAADVESYHTQSFYVILTGSVVDANKIEDLRFPAVCSEISSSLSIFSEVVAGHFTFVQSLDH